MKNRKKNVFALALVVVMALAMTVPLASAAGTKTYSFNLTDIPQNQWDGARKEILLHVTQGDETRDITIPAKTEGMGHAVQMGLSVYENGTKTDRTMDITLVPTRLLSEALGINIDWNSETASVEFDTYKGHISIPVGATSITMPDGSTWQETTYTYPDGSPIQLAMVRNQESRTYLPIRAFSSIAFQESRWDWHDAARLEGWVTLPESEMQWTDEQKTKLETVWKNGVASNIAYLPHTAKVLKETGAMKRSDGRGLVINPQDVNSATVGVTKGYERNEIWITGLDTVIGMNPDVQDQDYLKILKAILLDIVPDESDARAIGQMFDEVEKYQCALNAAAVNGASEAELDAIIDEYNKVTNTALVNGEWVDLPIEYNSVVLQWHKDWKGLYVSITKK